MLNSPDLYVTLAVSGLGAVGILAATGLAGWRGWLALKQLELTQRQGEPAAAGVPATAARIELADLKERIRKLEAIASGVDL